MSPGKTRTKKPSVFNRILNGIERVGNKLPHPITLFGIFALAIILISALCSWLGVSATGELIDSHTLETTTQTVTAVSLLSRDGIVYMLTNLIGNFTSFAPLGVVLVTMLAARAGYSESYFMRAFKRHTGMTAVQFINDCRLRKAALLLRGSALPVEEIAYRTGFESASYFIRRFKEKYKFTPNEYRKQQN